LHGAGGLSSQIRSMRFVVIGTRESPAASRSEWRGFHVLYRIRFGSAPTREPGGKFLINHDACVGVVGIPVTIKVQYADSFRNREKSNAATFLIYKNS